MKIINFDPGNPSLTLCVVWLAAARVGRMPYPWQPDEENRACDVMSSVAKRRRQNASRRRTFAAGNMSGKKPNRSRRARGKQRLRYWRSKDYPNTFSSLTTRLR